MTAARPAGAGTRTRMSVAPAGTADQTAGPYQWVAATCPFGGVCRHLRDLSSRHELGLLLARRAWPDERRVRACARGRHRRSATPCGRPRPRRLPGLLGQGRERARITAGVGHALVSKQGSHMTEPVHKQKRRSRGTTIVLLIALFCAMTAASDAPGAVRLASPPDDASVESGPVLTWSAVRKTDHYELQLAADNRFASSVLGTSSNSLKTANTAATLSKQLADGTYYWRVRAVTAAGRAGHWSKKRSFVKAWATAPVLLEPNDLFEVIWPIAPLKLHWSSVPHAVAYSVVIGTDPSLAAPIIGGSRSPVETQGTTLALPNALAPGTYYWAVTPKDANGHSGHRSAVGSFDWTWPSQTTTALNDLNADPRVLDPQFAWTAVPGAARYQVEVNPSHDWTPASKVCCDDPTIGTSLSPTSLLGNNTYYWRVRALDAQGDVGVWNEGPSFQKDFDPVGPQVPSTIPNLRIRDDVTDPLGSYPVSTSNPILQWDPVPGASSYEVQLLDWNGSECDLLDPVVDSVVYGLAWAPTAEPPSPHIGPTTWPNAHGFSESLATGGYCVRVLAQ